MATFGQRSAAQVSRIMATFLRSTRGREGHIQQRSATTSAHRTRVHLINPSNSSFGTAVITPRWLYVMAAATPESFGDPLLVDETLQQSDPLQIHQGDVVGISIHTGNALRGYDIGKAARDRGALLSSAAYTQRFIRRRRIDLEAPTPC